MKIKELFETQRDKVILIDFQPAYSSASGYKKAISNVIKYINDKDVEVICLFNGSDVTHDDKNDVIYHFFKYGLQEDKIDNFIFHEKTYGFLRDWMDIGVERSTIIRVLRYMLLHKINDVEDIEREELEKLIDDEWDIDELQQHSLYFIDLPVALLKSFSNALIGGGGRSECLAEVQIILSLFNIRNKEVQQWIYE